MTTAPQKAMYHVDYFLTFHHHVAYLQSMIRRPVSRLIPPNKLGGTAQIPLGDDSALILL